MTNQEQWSAIDRYFADALLTPDPALDAAQARSTAVGLPSISVSPLQGKLLHLLARAIGAHSILELRHAGRVRTIWLARGRCLWMGVWSRWRLTRSMPKSRGRASPTPVLRARSSSAWVRLSTSCRNSLGHSTSSSLMQTRPASRTISRGRSSSRVRAA